MVLGALVVTADLHQGSVVLASIRHIIYTKNPIMDLKLLALMEAHHYLSLREPSMDSLAACLAVGALRDLAG